MLYSAHGVRFAGPIAGCIGVEEIARLIQPPAACGQIVIESCAIRLAERAELEARDQLRVYRADALFWQREEISICLNSLVLSASLPVARRQASERHRSKAPAAYRGGAPVEWD